MDEKQYGYIIIGGGISGLSFAHYMSQRGEKVLVLEKDEIIGGQIQSPLSKTNPNYWRELGAHTCYNSYTSLLDIVTDLDVADHVRELGKGSYVLYAQNKIKSIVSQIAFPSLLFNGPKLFFSKKEGKTVKEYFGNIVGNKNYDKLFTRLFRAVLSQNADEYPAEVFLKRRTGRQETFPRKYSFSRGLHSFLNLIVEKNNLEVKTSCEVTNIKIDEQTSNYTLQTSNGEILACKHLAFATDPQTTAKLIEHIEPQIACILNSISLFKSESVNIIVEKKRIQLKPVAGIIPVSDEFHSAVSRDLVEDDKLRSFTFHFPKGVRNKSKKEELICNVLSIDKKDILEWDEDSHILPSLRIQHLDLCKQIEKARTKEYIYILGNYFYGLSIEDCINRSLDEAKRTKD